MPGLITRAAQSSGSTVRRSASGMFAAWAGWRSSEFQRRQAGDCENRGDDPEADDDGRLGPSLLLEMMMQRRHAEHPLAGQLEACDLDDHRDGLQDEQTAD